MDKATLEFVRKHKDKLLGKVLEVGSLDVNGGIRSIVEVFGIDMREGPGVDLVCSVDDLGKHFEMGYFDACVSCGTFEHIENWKAFVTETWAAVKEGGWLVLTVASLDKGRHDYPNDYWRFSMLQLMDIYPGMKEFERLGQRKHGRCVSYGWVVQKTGELGSLDIQPVVVL